MTALLDRPVRIAVAGGGPGGLTLARLLHARGVPCEVFEREADPDARPQGGTLDLHPDSGQLALAEAGLAEGLAAIARHEDQGVRVVDREGRVLLADDAGAGDRPEVDRTALRRLLLASLPAGAVRWGAPVEALRPAGGGRWEVATPGGVHGPFDLVVGADGAWSRVRPLLSRYRPQFSGVCFVEFGIDDADRAHPALAALVGRGKLVCEAGGKALYVQRNGQAHLRGYAMFRVPAEWAQARFGLDEPAAVRAALLDEFAGFAPPLRALLQASGDAFAVRPIVALPVGHHWTHRPGLTLLGDAAHVMSPFGGDGVNNAMWDALALARAIAAHGDLAAAVPAFEAAMFERTEPSADGAAQAVATLLSHVGQELTLETYRGHLAARDAPAA
jgi:2-polyprenyl-6-methoxyphenol hydroxylase-like FAD-dependent oxidoreductase